MDAQKLANERRIFTCRGGSHAYGLNTPTSDEDFRGVFIGLLANVFGFFPIEHAQFGGDYMVYEFRKFVNLAKECNPNIIELLFVDERDILFSTPQWEKLRAHRDWFLTRKARHTFAGYAHAQLKKIRGHKTWLGNPQSVEPPSPAKYVRRKWIDDLGNVEVFDQNAYDAAKRTWESYWSWKNNRNETRAKMEEESGYDRKHAMHLVRLLRMAHEILRGDGVLVKRADRDELLSIRDGAWSYEEVVAHAQDLEAKLEELYENSPLPHSPDVHKINDLMLEIYGDFWRERGEF